MGSGTCGGKSTSKICLFVFNFVFWLAGAIILGVGIWLKVDPTIAQYLKIVSLDQSLQYISVGIYIMIGVGAFIFLVGFLGCCGAIKESRCLLFAYAFVITVTILCEIVIVILGFVYRQQLGDFLLNSMSQQASSNVTNVYAGADPLTIAWHTLQVELMCCGGLDADDYRNNTHFNSTFQIPLSCCVLEEDGKDPLNPIPVDYTICVNRADPNYYYYEGCYDSLVNWMNARRYILIGIALGVAIIQILGIILACYMRHEIEE